jgi:hypothetical protein
MNTKKTQNEVEKIHSVSPDGIDKNPVLGLQMALQLKRASRLGLSRYHQGKGGGATGLGLAPKRCSIRSTRSMRVLQMRRIKKRNHANYGNVSRGAGLWRGGIQVSNDSELRIKCPVRRQFDVADRQVFDFRENVRIAFDWTLLAIGFSGSRTDPGPRPSSGTSRNKFPGRRQQPATSASASRHRRFPKRRASLSVARPAWSAFGSAQTAWHH